MVFLGQILCAAILLHTAADAASMSAQKDPQNRDEIEVIFRISRQFLDEVVRDEISARIPIDANVIGFHCCGTIIGQATLSVDLQSRGRQAVFFIDSRGSAQARITGRRGPLVAVGSAWGPFTSRTLVRFDGRRFTHVSTTPCPQVCGKLSRVTGRRDRRAGRLIGRSVMPLANAMLPQAVAQAVPLAKRYLKEFVEETAAKIIAELNRRTPLEETVNRLFPETEDWIFHMSSTGKFIQAAYGPSSATVPEFETEDEQWARINVQIRLRSTGEEAQSLAQLSQLPLARELLDSYIKSTLPELDLIGDDRSIDAIDNWVVITIGSRKPE